MRRCCKGRGSPSLDCQREDDLSLGTGPDGFIRLSQGAIAFLKRRNARHQIQGSPGLRVKKRNRRTVCKQWFNAIKLCCSFQSSRNSSERMA